MHTVGCRVHSKKRERERFRQIKDTGDVGRLTKSLAADKTCQEPEACDENHEGQKDYSGKKPRVVMAWFHTAERISDILGGCSARRVSTRMLIVGSEMILLRSCAVVQDDKLQRVAWLLRASSAQMHA